jgi:uncharacterized protein (DUF427 family)
MASSPGHKKWPDHRVIEEHPDQRVVVTFAGEKIANSTSAIKVVEDNHPPRFYIPREDVNVDVLERSTKTSECPFKGTAHYFSIQVGDHRADDAVRSYEDPYDEHRDLKDRLAFYDEKVDQLEVSVA